MRKLKILLITVSIFLCGAYSFNAQTENLSLNANVVNARLVKPLVLSANGIALGFGTIVLKTTTGGTVILEPTSQSLHTRTFSNATDLSRLGTGSNGNSTMPLFTVASEINLAYKITIPTSVTVTHATLTTNTMTVTDFKYLHSKGDGTLYTSTSALNKSWTSSDGSDTFALGATLTIDASQVAGTYAGTYPISVQYD